MRRRREEVSGKFVYDLRDNVDKKDFEILLKSTDLYEVILCILYNLRIRSKYRNQRTVSIEKFRKDIYTIIKENNCSDLF